MKTPIPSQSSLSTATIPYRHVASAIRQLSALRSIGAAPPHDLRQKRAFGQEAITRWT